jgi:hypothetical protein
VQDRRIFSKTSELEFYIMSSSKNNSQDNKPPVNPNETDNKSAKGPEIDDDKDTEQNFSSFGTSVPRKADKNKKEKTKSSSGKSSIVSWMFGKR